MPAKQKSRPGRPKNPRKLACVTRRKTNGPHRSNSSCCGRQKVTMSQAMTLGCIQKQLQFGSRTQDKLRCVISVEDPTRRTVKLEVESIDSVSVMAESSLEAESQDSAFPAETVSVAESSLEPASQDSASSAETASMAESTLGVASTLAVESASESGVDSASMVELQKLRTGQSTVRIPVAQSLRRTVVFEPRVEMPRSKPEEFRETASKKRRRRRQVLSRQWKLQKSVNSPSHMSSRPSLPPSPPLLPFSTTSTSRVTQQK